MKRLSFLLAVCLLFTALVPAAALEPFHYASRTLGFSMTVPGLSDQEIAVEEYETGVHLFHAPSQEKWGGLIGSIEVVAPRSKFFSEEYSSPAYQVLAMGEDRIFLWKSPGGGVNTGKEMLDAFTEAASALSVDHLKQYLAPMCPDDQPRLNETRHLAYLTADNGLIRPDGLLTRGDLAEMLFVLLEAANKEKPCETPFTDMAEASCAQAVNYLASYGILSGYADGTFRPDAPVSRAAFAVLLHRCQFAVPVGRYGDLPENYADVPAACREEEAIYSAAILGWMTGDSNGLFHPERGVTRAEAVTAINRMLGRDESHTSVEAGLNPYADLQSGHWAYQNILEAAGVLSSDFSAFEPDPERLPKETVASHFLSESDGWAVSEAQLRRTADGGETWSKTGEPFTFDVSGIFFFNSREGVLLGHGRDMPCVLLQTADGGETWSRFPAEQTAQAPHFPTPQFPSETGMLNAIVSAEFRPASRDAVYLTIRYRPYESIYLLNFEAVWQTAVTGGDRRRDAMNPECPNGLDVLRAGGACNSTGLFPPAPPGSQPQR